MKKQSPIKRLYEPSHPILGKIVLSAGILLAVISCVLVLQHQSELLFLTKQSTLPATATPAPALNPAYFTLTPTPTLAPGQKAIYTFYIQATSHKTSNEELTLNTSNAGKILTADIGTLIIVNFGRVGNLHVSASSPQAIFTNLGRPETIHLPNEALGAFRVYRAGFGTITVIEKE